MKVKAIKPHYYTDAYIMRDEVYFCDKVHGDKVVRLGICEEIKIEDKRKKPRGRPKKK